MIVLGIDPGNGGAFCLLDETSILEVWDMPVIKEEKATIIHAPLVYETLSCARFNYAPDVVYLEKVGGMPRDAPRAAFRFGLGVGIVEVICCSLGMGVVLAPPVLWKAQMGLSGRMKEASRSKAIELWPGHASHFRLKKHEGRAEAALIAAWGLKKERRK